MPIYEYECPACGHRLEAIQKFNEAPLSDCPTCGKAGLKRLISAAGFQLKGSGWYATDFRNSGKNKDTKSDSKTADSGTSSESGTAEPEKKAHACGGGACGCAH